MSRHRDRTPDADARQNSPLLDAPVDVFITTYNEPYAVLERTIVGALATECANRFGNWARRRGQITLFG
jgi:cellulose synthase/poly-beta-1,6-N-acetylglucosamine synthase-like glycosyltransferase